MSTRCRLLLVRAGLQPYVPQLRNVQGWLRLLQKLWGGRPRPQPAPGRPSSILQMLDTSTEQRDEGVPRRPGVCPTRHPQNPRTGKTMRHYGIACPPGLVLKRGHFYWALKMANNIANRNQRPARDG